LPSTSLEEVPIVIPSWSKGPVELVLVRHGQSRGNAANDAATESGAESLDLTDRDADVELSDTGRRQAEGLAEWLGSLEPGSRPTRAVTSPYRRAAQTAVTALDAVGLDPDVDERLRERDLGVFDGLTGAGIRRRHPEESDRRDKLGKFYYQPPSGESWADVVLRVRSLLPDLREAGPDERVWLFTHQAVIMAFRYVLEGLSEAEILDIDKTVTIPNASITRYRRVDDRLELRGFAETDPVDGSAAEVTAEPDTEGDRER
jgi:broad specificity phosphatase PhoE